MEQRPDPETYSEEAVLMVGETVSSEARIQETVAAEQDLERSTSALSSFHIGETYSKDSALTSGETVSSEAHLKADTAAEQDLEKSTSALSSLNVNDQEPKKEPEPEDLIPSLTMDRQFIWEPPSAPEGFDLKSEMGGKWMLFCNMKTRAADGLTELDQNWFQIRNLVRQGKIMVAKCATGADHELNYKKAERVIVCYTDNYKNKRDVKRVADAIRSVVSYDKPMYYKTNQATAAKLHAAFGDRYISLYRCLDNGMLQQRAERGWIPAFFK